MNLIELAPLEALQVAVPQKTVSYSPVGNRDLLAVMQQQIEGYGLNIVGADMRVAANGQQFMGTIQFGSEDTHIQQQMGFRNSYNKSFAVGFGAGANVLVCSNGMFLADVKSVRKHTSKVWYDIEHVMQDQLMYMDDTFQRISNDAQDMQNTMLSSSDIRDVIGKLWIDQEVLTAQQMNIMRGEMFYSDNFKMFDKGAPIGEGTAWNMYNNITEALKVSHPSKYFKNHEKVHETLMTYA
jgi:hypothetical protein